MRSLIWSGMGAKPIPTLESVLPRRGWSVEYLGPGEQPRRSLKASWQMEDSYQKAVTIETVEFTVLLSREKTNGCLSEDSANEP